MPGVNTLARIPEMAGNSPFKEYPSAFMHGVIVFIDPERWTVTVQIQETGARQYNVPIMSPYFFRERGQGAYFIPEVGAQCLVCYAYGQPFVLGFLPPIDSISKGSEIIDNLSESAGTYKPPTPSGAPPLTSYRNNREGEMLPGDYCIKTKGRNRLKLLTNGNVLIEASKVCMRVFSKLKNWITDYCINYTLNTPGGQINFKNDEDTGDTDLTREVRKNIDDEEFSFTEKIGKEGDIYNRTVKLYNPFYPDPIKPSNGILLYGVAISGDYSSTIELDDVFWVVRGDGDLPAGVEIGFEFTMEGEKKAAPDYLEGYAYYQVEAPTEEKYARMFAYNYKKEVFEEISNEKNQIKGQLGTGKQKYKYELDPHHLSSDNKAKIRIIGNSAETTAVLAIDFVSYHIVIPAGDMTYSEQINEDGSVLVKAMAGGHIITLDKDKIRIETNMLGVKSLTFTDDSVKVETDQKIILTGPGGTLTIAPDLSTWEVLGDLEVTVTGDGTIDTQGTLNLNPTPVFPFQQQEEGS